MQANPLQLDAFYIDRMAFETVDGYDPESPETLVEVRVQPQHLCTPDDNQAHQIILSVEFRPSQDDSAPYQGLVQGRAFLHVAPELGEDETAQYVLVNGASILLGLLRGQLVQVTAQGRWGTFLLPAVNLYDVWQAAELDQPAALPENVDEN